jgi:UDP-N-acetylmuramoyl-L-alanyl-D-glutamate--2,6-diaminopimelate ligase
LNVFGGSFSFDLKIPGKFSVYNVLGAIAVCLNLGISVRTVMFGVEKIQNVPGRIQPVPNTRGFNVFVDYAHSPDGLENIISAVKGFTRGRVITVFGCGGDKDKAKRPIMGKIAGELSDLCVITSDNPRSESSDIIIDEIEKGMLETKCEYIKQSDRKEAIFYAVKRAEKGDSVIIAGKGHEDYQEFEQKRRIPFNDTVVAKEALEGLE